MLNILTAKPVLKPTYFYLAIIFWTGFAALIYQIYSIRVLFMFFVENTHAVALAISSFLGGLAFSSLLFSRLSRGNTRNCPLICGMMLAAAAYGYLLIAQYTLIPPLLDAIHQHVTLAWLAGCLKYLVLWMYLFPPAFLMGGVFPLVNGLYLKSLKNASYDTGTVYFWDTLGAIAGALVTGFVFLPVLGLYPTAIIAVCINLMIAMMLMPKRSYAYCAAGCLGFIVVRTAYVFVNEPELYFKLSDAGHILPVVDMDNRFGHILFQQESPYGRVTVGQNSLGKTLFVNYRGMCDLQGFSGRELADNTMALLPPGSQVLNIGLGCGLTASQLAFHPHTRALDIAEINPVIPQAAMLFNEENKHVLKAPNVMLHITDGAAWLRNTPRRYNAIVVDIEEVSVLYSSPLYTREYFAIIRDHLKESGVFALWSFTVSPEFTRIMYNTLRSEFPYVEMLHYRDSATTYYASMHSLAMRSDSIHILPSSSQFSQKVKSLPNNEINTLENATLEKYYNSNQNFSLPNYYKEDFVHKSD